MTYIYQGGLTLPLACHRGHGCGLLDVSTEIASVNAGSVLELGSLALDEVARPGISRPYLESPD